MMKVSGKIFLSVCLSLSPVCIYGQDLGSASGIFRSTNQKTKNASTKTKSNPPAKKTPSKTKTTRSSNSVKKTPANDRRTTTASTNTAPRREPPKTTKKPADKNISENIVITVPENPAEALRKEEFFDSAIEEGNAARDVRNYERAESSYRRAAGIKPNDFRAVYGIGNLYSDQHRWEEAERSYREAIKLSPGSPESYVAISFVLTQPIPGKDVSARYVEAETMARKAIELDPTNPFAFDQLGAALELNGKIDGETLGAYQRAIQLDPEFALAYAHLGRLLRRQGKINESAEAYRKAMQFAKDVPTMIQVADVFQSQQRFTDSEQLLRAALREDPKNPTALYLLGRALTTRAAFDEAETILRKSLEVSPNSFVSYTLLSSLYSRQGKYKDAEKILMEALKVVSENERKRLAREFEMVGDGLMTKKMKLDAVRVYQQAIALDTDNNGLAEKAAKARQN